MKKNKQYLTALTALLIGLLASSCISTPPDVRVCARRPFNSGAQCNNTLSNSPYDMKEAEYRSQEIGMVFMDAKAFGEIKKYIKEMCIRVDKCDEEGVAKKLDELSF